MKKPQIKLSLKEETTWALGLILIYLIFSFVWHYLSTGTWDGDCVGRYLNVQNAFNNPRMFIGLWNRPLYVILFVIPVKIFGKDGVMMMALISAISAWALYRSAKILEVKNALMVIPFFLFQAFFFTISRSALTEPLAAAIFALMFLFYLRKKFLYFAILGALIPLARLELGVFMVFWAYLLYKNGYWKYIFIFAIPSLLWSLGGTILDGDLFWLYEKTLGKDVGENRYGHTDFWHYFQRFAYVIGPIIFYFLFIGLMEKIKKLRSNLFIVGQFVVGFILYVLFSWKFNLGHAAGFLRHLASLAPMIAFIALYGYNYWLNSLIREEKSDNKSNTNLDKRIKQITIAARKKNLKEKEIKKLVAKEKQRFKDNKGYDWQGLTFRIIMYSLIMAGLSLFFFSQELIMHHKFSDETDYKILFTIIGLTVLYVALYFVFRNKSLKRIFVVIVPVLIAGITIAYPPITEPPDIHNTPKRKTMTEVSNIVVNSSLFEHKIYINHGWFYWANDLLRNDDEKYSLMTHETIKEAPDSSIIIWESHYGNRLKGDIKVNYLIKQPQYVELFRKVASDKSFLVVVFQKLSNTGNDSKLTLYNQLIEEIPDLAGLYVNRGNVYRSMRKTEKAIVDYNTAIKKDSSSINAFNNRAVLYLNQNKIEKALSDFIKVRELNSKNHMVHHYIGVCYSRKNDYKSAAKSYSRAIKQKPEFSQGYYNRALAYTRLKKVDKAISDYTKVIDLKGNSSRDAYFNRGVLRLQKNNANKACKDLQEAVKMGHPQAQNLLRQYCN